MTWWCVSLREPWSWAPKAYPGIWLSAAALLVPYLLALRCRSGEPARRRTTAFFLLGVLAYWVATDWPLGTLGAGYLASAHMVQFLVYTLIAAPLLLLGTPEWMARVVSSRSKLETPLRLLARPLAAGLVYNAILLTSHSPLAVDSLRSSQLGSLGLDVAWLFAGVVLWLPILAPLPELRSRSYGTKLVYLFLAAQVVPMLPGGFLTFADFPLYSTYELAPRVWGLTARSDQALAGALMKVGGIPVVWGTMLALMLKWGRAEGHLDATRPAGAGGPAAN